MTVYKVPEANCPGCNTKLDMATDAVDGHTRPPQEGDYTLCAVCLSILQYTGTSLHMLTDKEIDELPIDIFEQMAAAALYIKLYKRRTQ